MQHEEESADVESPAATVELVTLSHEAIQRLETRGQDVEPFSAAEPASPEDPEAEHVSLGRGLST